MPATPPPTPENPSQPVPEVFDQVLTNDIPPEVAHLYDPVNEGPMDLNEQSAATAQFNRANDQNAAEGAQAAAGEPADESPRVEAEEPSPLWEAFMRGYQKGLVIGDKVVEAGEKIVSNPEVRRFVGAVLVETLESSGYIKRGKDGKLQVDADAAMTAARDVSEKGGRKFVKDLLGKAKGPVITNAGTAAAQAAETMAKQK